MRVDGNELNYMHQATILLQMNPRESLDGSQPDLILTFDLASFNRNRANIEELRKGDYIRFNATMTHFNVKRIA